MYIKIAKHDNGNEIFRVKLDDNMKLNKNKLILTFPEISGLQYKDMAATHVDDSCRRILEVPAGKTPFPVGTCREDTVSGRKMPGSGSRNPFNGSGGRIYSVLLG